MEEKGMRTMAIPVLLQVDCTLFLALTMNHVKTTQVSSWGPTACADAPVLTFPWKSFPRRKRSGKVLHCLWNQYPTKRRGNEGAEWKVTHIQSFAKPYLDLHSKNKCFSTRRIFIVTVIDRVEKKIKLKALVCFLCKIALYFWGTFIQLPSIFSAIWRGWPAEKLACFPLAPGPSFFLLL